MEPEFGDITPDDVYTEGDDEVDWSNVEKVASQIDSIQDIDDPEERLEAAELWVIQLNGGV